MIKKILLKVIDKTKTMVYGFLLSINSYRLFLLDLNDLILINSIPFKKIEVSSGRNM